MTRPSILRPFRLALPIFATATALPAFALADAPPQVAASSTTDAGPVETINVVGTQTPILNLNQPSTAGSRLGLTPLETPASVSLVSGEEIRDLQLTTVSDAKTMAPGITSFDTPGNGNNSFANRGFYGENSVKQLYNGTEIYNAGGVVSFPFDPWNIDHIEVLSGPGSVLYGTGAIGGAINVVPKRPDPTNASNQIQLSTGSFNTHHEAIDSTGPIEGTPLSYRIDASHYSSDGFVDRAFSSSTAVSGSLRWDVDPDLFVILSDDYGIQHPSSYEGTPILNGKPVPGLSDANFNASDVKLGFVDNWTTLATTWTPTADISVYNNAYYLTHHRQYHDIYDYQYLPATRTVKLTDFRDINADENQFGDTGYAKFEGTVFGHANSVLAGFDLNRNSYDREDNTNASGSYGGSAVVSAFDLVPILYSQGSSALYVPKYKTTVDQYGAFTEDRLSVTQQVSLVAGLRFDHYETSRQDEVLHVTTDSDDDSTGYNIGLVYNPVENVSLYGQYAIASDPVSSLPSISASQQPFSLSQGTQVEIGAKESLWDHRLEATIAGYNIVKSNLLAPSPANPAVSVQVGQQSSHGLEASLAFRPDDQWRIEANGTILKAQYDSFDTTVGGKIVSLRGFVPVDVPQHSANFRVFWNFLPDWEARVTAQWVGGRYVDATNLTQLPGYTVVNAGLRWDVTQRAKLDLVVDNVFDKTYAEASSNTTLWARGEPLNANIALNVSF